MLTQIDDGEHVGRLSRYHLHEGAVRTRVGKNRAQRFMSPQHVVKSASQSRPVEGTREFPGHGHVEDGGIALELFQKPHPFLGEGRRERRLALLPRQGANHDDLAGVGTLGIDSFDEVGHGGRLEQGPHREVDPKDFANAGDRLRREQGMAPQIKEVVVDTYAFTAEHRGPHVDQKGLVRGSRCGHILGRTVHLRRGQGLAIHFAIWGQGKSG